MSSPDLVVYRMSRMMHRFMVYGVVDRMMHRFAMHRMVYGRMILSHREPGHGKEQDPG